MTPTVPRHIAVIDIGKTNAKLVLIDDGQTIALEPRMMEVLIALAERAGEVVCAEQLLIEVWHGSSTFLNWPTLMVAK